MKKKQILTALGYKETEEDGACCEHPDFIWEDRFVWKDQTIEEILKEHNKKVERCVRFNMCNEIMSSSLI
jgi:translation elongation factor EF-Ts